MRRIKVVPLEATGIYLVDVCGVPIVKAQRASTGVSGSVVSELPPTLG
jgi:hypothetical protein